MDSSKPRNCIAFYQAVVSDSLILLISDPKLVKDVPIDLDLTRWKEMDTGGAAQIYAIIMDKLG